MNARSKITYNLNHTRRLFEIGGIDAATMYYLFKTIFSNSIIYDTSIKNLYHRLKTAKIISRNFKYKRFADIFEALQDNDFIKFDEKNNHFILCSIHENKGFYKSKILYTKGVVVWNDIVECLIKEELKYTKFKQEKGIKLRSKITAPKKAYKLFKRLYKKGLLDKYSGESFAKGIVFTYRTMTSKVGLSIKTVHKHIRSLADKKDISIKTIKEVGDILPCKLDFVRDTIKCYCYIDNKNRLVKVIGSQLLDID